MTRNTKLISSYKLLGISPEVIQSYYYDVPTKNIRCSGARVGTGVTVGRAAATGEPSPALELKGETRLPHGAFSATVVAGTCL